MKLSMLCLTVTALVLMGSLVGAQEALVLYDNFEGKTLDPEKWFGGQWTDTGMVTLETGRLMKNEGLLASKGLNLFNRSYANTESDSGRSTASTRIYFSDGSDIKTIETTVLVKKIEMSECNNNTDAAEVRVRIGGAFFNIGEPIPGNSTNDVWGQITIGRASDSADPAGTLHVYARVYRCTNADCSSIVNLVERQDLGTVKLNTKVKVRMTWNPDNKKFVFQKGKGPGVEVPYGFSTQNPPGGLNGGMKRFEVQNFLPNCTGEPRPVGYIEAAFDNVKVNASALP